MTDKPDMRIKVGLVEDDAIARNSWVTLLNAHPQLSCIADCATAEEAIQRLPEAKPDVIMMDINLPGMSGIKCTAQLKALLPRVHILMVTAFSNDDYIFEALKAGASGYLLKSKSADEVSDAILNVMEGGVPMTGQIARRVIAVFRQPAPTEVEEARLTARENEILHLLAKGLSNKEIASKIDTGVANVRRRIESIYQKLHVHCRTEAAAKYLAVPNKPGGDRTSKPS
jgi:DNA-binding NarL/FixJ family response regulator